MSKVNGSAFCSGIRTGVIDSITQGVDDLRYSRLSVLLEFALKVNDVNVTIEQNDIQIVLDANWSEQTIEDVVGLVAIQKLYSTI